MDASISEPAEARRTLDTIEALRRASARRARGGHWFPITLFGLLTLVVAAQGLGNHSIVTGYATGEAQLVPLNQSEAIAPEWLVGIPLVYVATVVFYLWRAERVGIGTSRLTFVLAGVGLTAVVSVLVALRLPPPDLWGRGFTPLLTVALGFFVLSYLERSAPLALFSVGFLGLALLACLYDIENYVPLGTDRFVNPLVVAAYLLAAGAGFGLAARRSRGRRA